MHAIPPRASAACEGRTAISPAVAKTRVEIVAGKQIPDLRAAWSDLSKRAAEHNVFMNPDLVRIAAESYSDASPFAVLAWKDWEGGECLTGFWAFDIGHANKSAFPLRVLKAPAFSHAYLSTPVIDRTCLEETLVQMLDFIDQHPGLPKIIALDAMRLDGPTMPALAAAVAARNSNPLILQVFNRPRLESPLDGKAYLELALSNSSRKKLRQHRRRLAERGALTAAVHSKPDAVASALDQFLALEASGWKGRQRTALACDESNAAFFRRSFSTLAASGAASIHALYIDQRPISMQLVVRQGDTGFTWKTAYDEEYQDFSPGMLLLEDCTTSFLRDEMLAAIDSCAFDDSSYMSVWRERQQIGDIWIDARRGGSPAFHLMGKLESLFRDLRSRAKRQYGKLRQSSR